MSGIPGRGRTDVLDYHSSVQDGARAAAKNGVGAVVLTHLVPPPAPGTEEEWAALAKEEFDASGIVAEDLTPLDLSVL